MTSLLRIILAVLGAGAVLGGVYLKGRQDCNERHLEKRAEAAERWADTIANVMGAATARALDAQERKLDNERIAKEIADAAAKELGANDECLSADVVDRLRELR